MVAAEFAMVLAFLLVVGVAAWQFGGLALTALKVGSAAQQAAYTAAGSLEINGDRTPCWEMAGGLKDPARYGDPEVCRAVTASLGDLDPELTSVSVVRNGQGKAPTFQVTVTYREPLTSPLLRAFFGPIFIVTSRASSWSG